jgi:hypothetical protein
VHIFPLRARTFSNSFLFFLFILIVFARSLSLSKGLIVIIFFLYIYITVSGKFYNDHNANFKQKKRNPEKNYKNRVPVKIRRLFN